MCAERVFQSRTDKLCALVASDGSEDSATRELFDFYTKKTMSALKMHPRFTSTATLWLASNEGLKKGRIFVI